MSTGRNPTQNKRIQFAGESSKQSGLRVPHYDLATFDSQQSSWRCRVLVCPQYAKIPGKLRSVYDDVKPFRDAPLAQDASVDARTPCWHRTGQ